MRARVFETPPTREGTVTETPPTMRELTELDYEDWDFEVFPAGACPHCKAYNMKITKDWLETMDYYGIGLALKCDTCLFEWHSYFKFQEWEPVTWEVIA